MSSNNFIIFIKQDMLVLGLFRISSDMVADFGNSVKHPIEYRLLSYKLTEFYEQVQQLMKSKLG